MKQAHIAYKDNLNGTVTFTGFTNVMNAQEIRAALGTKYATRYFKNGGFFFGNPAKKMIQCFDHTSATKTFVVGTTYPKKEFVSFLSFCKRAGTRLSAIRREASKPVEFLV